MTTSTAATMLASGLTTLVASYVFLRFVAGAGARAFVLDSWRRMYGKRIANALARAHHWKERA